MLGIEVGHVEPGEPLALAADRDHARVGGGQQVGHEEAGERERTEVIRAELGLEAVGRPGERHHGHAGVVHQEVEAVVAPALGETADGFQVGEIEHAQLGVGAGYFVSQPLHCRPPALVVAAGQDDMGAAAGEFAGGDVPDAAVGACDDDQPTRLVRDAIGCPPHARNRVREARGTPVDRAGAVLGAARGRVVVLAVAVAQ